ncbi:hypothetical protein CspeluHIS016_0602080 [Cutaneotrichosporon spelunceum]|uniref:Uncharacterized protein n=1 Tax=Cutaneotrichosporon spelunceum TaxID=1672016 RepID=A0AAD3TXM8_9TREE|nr:hypothetical protein CspeluHIS016_0602080 [Cutaneotrichosporon spelunceum]
MTLDSEPARAAGKQASAARPVRQAPRKLGPFAVANIAALVAVLVASAYISSEQMPSMPGWGKYWNKRRNGADGKEGQESPA